MKQNRTPTGEAFRQFLNWLDQGVDSGGQTYLEMRRRLVFYFDRKNCLSPEELADETLNRVAQKVEDKGEITGLSPAHYCYVVAKFVFLEYLRQAKRGQAGLEELTYSRQPTSLADPKGAVPHNAEKLHECLDRCLAKLQAADRELILEYYRGEGRAKIERRAGLAARLGLSLNAVTIKACRIRNKLEACVKACRDEEE